MRSIFRSISSGLALSAVLVFVGCGGEGLPNGLFSAAADALGPKADHDRARVVNPVLLSEGNPRMSARDLQRFQDEGYEVLGGDGLEDPAKATLYFTVPEAKGDGEYRVRIFVSLGARPGTMHRGDSWWQADLRCEEECGVLEIEPIDAPGWSRTSPIR